jgi:hypothetical protein
MSKFKVGDEVHWTRKTSRGRTIDFKAMQGKIITTEDLRPDVVTVKYRNGQTVRVHTSRLRLEGEHTELTDLVNEIEERGLT